MYSYFSQHWAIGLFFPTAYTPAPVRWPCLAPLQLLPWWPYWGKTIWTEGCSGLVLQMLKALVLIITAGLAAKMSGEDWTCQQERATKEDVRFLARCTNGGRQQQRENMLLSHPSHPDPPHLFSPWPCPAISPEKLFFPWLLTSKYIPPEHSLVFNQYFPLNCFLPCFVSSLLIPPIFLAASSPVLHLFSSESSYLRDIKGRCAFLSHCRPTTQKPA